MRGPPRESQSQTSEGGQLTVFAFGYIYFLAATPRICPPNYNLGAMEDASCLSDM